MSTSDHRVYFVSGQDDLRYLATDGTTGVAAKLPNVKGRTQSVVAVSPDDARMAVAVFDWSQPPLKVSIYVENLGGGNRVDIFNSNSVYEWPVGWHAGLLVIGVGTVLGSPDNPYAAVVYHLVDSTTGLRQAELGSSTCRVVGPLVQGGTACTGACGADVCVSAVDWTGHQREMYRQKSSYGYSQCGGWAPLSPDGNAVELSEISGPEGCLGSYVVNADSSQVKLPAYFQGPVWWLDTDTLAVFGSALPPAAGLNPVYMDAAFYRLSTGAVIPIGNLGLAAGVVPGLS